MDQRPDAGDHQHHEHRQLIELEGPIDAEVAGGHPGEVSLHEGRVHLSRAAHGEPHGHGERERQREHPGPDEAHEAGEARPSHRVVIVPRGARVLGVRVGGGVRVGRPVSVRGGIRGSRAIRTDEREQPVQHEPEQGQEREQPEVLGRRAGERVRPRRGRRVLEEHHPLSRLMFLRSTDSWWRKIAMMIASPTAASAAATVMTKTTNT